MNGNKQTAVFTEEDFAPSVAKAPTTFTEGDFERELAGGPPIVSREPIFGRTRISEKPALGFLQRAKVSFGDIPGRRQYLQKLGYNIVQKTPEGNFIVEDPKTGDLRLTDPRSADLGDIADIAGGLFPLTGWTAGSLIGGAGGAPAGPAGIVTGAVKGAITGAASGQALRSGIGKAMGVYAGGPLQMAKEAALTGVEAGAWEAGMPFAKKALFTPAGRIIKEKIWKKALQPAVENIFNFTADIPKKALKIAIEKNPLKVITREYRSEELPFQLANRLEKGAKITRNAIAEKWADTVGKIKSKITNTIDYDNVLSQSRKIFQDFGLLDSRGYETKAFIKESPRWENIRNIWRSMTAHTKQTMPVSKALQARQEIDAIINKGFKDNIFTDKDVSLLKNIRRAFNRELHLKYPEMAQADAAYSQLNDAFDMIDIDWGNAKAVAQLETMLSKYPELKISIQNALKAVNDQLPKGQKFLDDAINLWTAKQFDPTVFRAIRTGMFERMLIPLSTLLGFSLGGPSGAVAGGLTGVAVSTPRIVGGLLRGGAKVREAVKAGQKVIPSAVRTGVTTRRQQSFNTEQEALSSGLPEGSVVTVKGRRYRLSR